MRNRSARGLIVLCLGFLAFGITTATLSAQVEADTAPGPSPALLLHAASSLLSPDAVPTRTEAFPPRPSLAGASGRPAAIRWYHAAGALGTIALVSLADDEVREEAQQHRSSGSDDAAKVFRHMGQPEVYATVALGTLGVGLISGNDRITRAGGRITAGLLLAGIATSGLKRLVGRRRPPAGDDQYSFRPFSSSDAFPSGHTTVAFALATGVSDELHSLPATIGLYTMAGLTGWSRINDDRHWLSDVLAGAAVGITSAKLMNGHWRVFGIGAPRFLLEPNGGAGVAWRVQF